jgi:hypothetical protein
MEPFLWVAPLLAALSVPFCSAFPWAARAGWLAPRAFFAREIAALAGVAAVGSVWKRRRGSDSAGRWGVVYLVAYAAGHSLFAFDWLMALEHPWVSTLFGGYLFVEAFYGAIALAVLAAADSRPEDPESSVPLRDAATLLFGFSLFWAGLFYAQFLVIWYGNKPEEAAPVARRLLVAPYRPVAWAILGLLFLSPFVGLLSRSAKTRRRWVRALSVGVWTGIAAERWLWVDPVLPVPLLPVLLGAGGLGLLVALSLRTGRA